MQRLGRCFTVCDKRKPNEASAGVTAIRLLPCEVAARDHADTGIPEKLDGHRFIVALCRDVEPDAEAAGGTPIAITAAEDLVGKVEFEPVEPAIFLDMGFVIVGGDGHMLD